MRANSIGLPTKRRAYTRGPDRRPILETLMVSIDISMSGSHRTGLALFPCNTPAVRS
jgi:hypothetical protein